MRLFALTISLAALVGTTFSSPLPLSEVKKHAARIDAALDKSLKSEGLKLNPKIDDGTFLRRSYLTVVGRIPTTTEARTFLDSKDSWKRSELIESLVQSPGQHSHLFNFWADTLRLRTRKDEHGLGWHVWIRQAVKDDMPYDEFVNRMLGATGHVAKNPAVGYYLRDRNMLLDNISNTAQVFLGQQIGCAQCHDHPFDDFSQLEYYELAAFGAGFNYRSQDMQSAIQRTVKSTIPDVPKDATRKEKRSYNKEKRQLGRDLRNVFRYENRNAISDVANKKIKLPHDYQYDDAKPGEVVEARFPFGKTPDFLPGKRRETFARWVTSSNNPYFTKVIVNRLWKHTFGYGLVAPVDDWAFDTEPSHPAVLIALEKAMKSCDYHNRDFLRILYHTKLFQATAGTVEPQPGKKHKFTGPVLRRMSAEQVHDSLLTLSLGNIDAVETTSFAQKWKIYQQSTTTRLNSTPEEILALDERLDSVQDQITTLRKKSRALKTKAIALRKDGKQREARKLFASASDLNQEIRALEKYGKGATMAMMMGPMNKKGEKKKMRFRRASEQQSPFNSGHMIRKFGGSDRQTPNASHTEASIPQSLLLLNNYEVIRIIHSKGQFGTELHRKSSSTEDKLNHLFLGLYARYPSQQDKTDFLPLTQQNRTLNDLARAMITSKRFLFIQ